MKHTIPQRPGWDVAWMLALLFWLMASSPGNAATTGCPLYTIQPGQTLAWPLRSTTAPSTTPGIHSQFPHHVTDCFSLHNTSNSTLHLSVYLENPRMNHAELDTESDGTTSSSHVGTDYPLPLWSTTGADTIFTVQLHPGAQSTHELLIGSLTPYNSMVRIMEREPLLQSLAREKNMAGALAGMIGILTIYFLFLAISTREKTFVYLAGSTAGVTLMQLSDLGLLYPLWPLSTHWNQTCSAFFAVLSTLFGNCLARHYLDTRTTLPRADKILNGFGWYMFLIALPLSLTNQQELMIPVFAIPALAFMVLLLAISIMRISQGFIPARLYLLAYLLPLVSGVTIVLITVGIVPSSPLSHLLPITGTAVQLILFSLALGERINWLNAERNTAHLAALQARTETQTKRHFLAQISHELRTPLIGIIGLAELIQRQHYNKNDIHLISGMESSARQLLQMTNTLLDHARLDAGKWVPQSSPLTIQAILQDIVTQVEPAARSKHLTISTHIHDNVPRQLTGDPTILQRILQELVDNALKFTPSGSIAIMVERLHTPANPDAASAMIRFDVIDTGIGFDTSFQSRIFELFELADASSTRQQQGSGLGLSLSKKFCQLLGGSIACDSHPNHGTVFWFVLPFGVISETTERLANNPAHQPLQQPVYRSPHETPRHLQPGKQILIAEDDAAIQIVVTALLSKIGCGAHTVFDNGRALLDHYRTHHATTAFVLLDWNMPLLNGQQTLHAIRAFEAENGLPAAPVAIMSAHDAHSRLAEALDPDVPILYKPVTTDALKRLLDIV